jgi:hypothetical protein
MSPLPNTMLNKSPESTAVLSGCSLGAEADGAGRFTAPVHVASRLWLGFFRQAASCLCIYLD